MQTIPVTYTLNSLQSALPRKLSAQEDPSAMGHSGFSIDFHKRQSVSPQSRSYKKRLRIFKEYNPRTHLVTENDDTVVYKSRKRAADSAQAKDPKLPVYQRYSEQENKPNRHGSHEKLLNQNTRRRSKMFNPFLPRAQNHRMSFFSKKQYKQDPPVITERFTKYIESVSSIPYQVLHQEFQNSSAKINNKIYLTSNNEQIKAPRLETFGMQGHLQTNLNPLCEIKQQIKQNLLISPKKITFTYHNHNNCMGMEQIPQPLISNSILLRKQTTNKIESPSLKRSLVLYQNNSFKNSIQITHDRLGNNKKNYDFGQQARDVRMKPIHKSMFRWGNKIQTELMGASAELDQKSPRQRDFASSKITMNQLKQSLVVNREKVTHENLKINESFSNISEDQSSNRYFDQQIDMVAEVKKISYGNIEISREEFTHESQGQFKPNQLLLEFQNNKFEAQKDEKIVNTSDQVKAAVSTKKDEQMATERQILGELQYLKQQLMVKQLGKTGKLLPVVLVVLASMLFVIQAIF